MSNPLKIYLFHHGETAWSLSGQHAGNTDLPLTPRGELMARALAPALQDIPFSGVLTSPRLRARATCELAGLAGAGQTAAQIEPSLAEWNYGDYESLRTVDIRKQHPEWDIWEDGCPNGETPAAIGVRADRVIARLQNLSGNVAVFSHGQFGRVLAVRWVGLAVTQGRHFTLNPASISVLGYDRNHPEQRIISLWNAAPVTHQELSRDVEQAADDLPQEI